MTDRTHEPVIRSRRRRLSAALLAACLLGSFLPANRVPAQRINETLRGIVKPVDEAMIASDLTFPIRSLPFREGQSFSKGDILVEFECGDLAAQVKSAEAMLRAEKITLENNQRLAKSRAVGNFEVELSHAKADQAAAELEGFRSKMSRCVIRAPYDGRVAVMRAHAHEIPEPNQPMMQIVNQSDLEIEILLPSDWLRWLRPRSRFTIRIDETGRSLGAEIVRIAAVVDPVSQTVKVTGRFRNGAEGVLPGMSGPTTFEDRPADD
ncbi:efflux RND transporter periplasmic adaptor subunit [Neorhizobium sp. NPDC001467]|uniref:efflux RND transporter periplasmic adaptor subunit n=1 Tax=Neorhizobium sp. NPDC001467 TaxID=3390595 RepID=UPI003CFF3DF0